MGGMRHCLLLVLLHLMPGLAFRETASINGNAHSTFFKNQNTVNYHYLRHKLTKRSTDPGGDACNALQGYGDRLINNTHMFSFHDLSGSVSLAWVGDGTGVVLALTTFQVPFFMLRFGQSKLYRSENYGKSFQDVTSLINNTFIVSEFGIAIGPMNSGKVILTGDVSGSRATRIFRSTNFGTSFTHTDLPFHPLTQINYSPQNAELLLALSVTDELWLSKDFGATWKKIHDTVCRAKWGRGNSIFFTTSFNGSCVDDKGMLELKRTTDLGKTIKTVANKIFSFILDAKFVFASVMTGKGTLRMIHVSVDQGETWNIAQLPPVSHEQFYSILAADDDVVFLHVDEPGDTNIGTLYVSDDRGTVYSKSLERHLYTSGSETDFTNVTSLRGVYMTSVLALDGSVQSVVSFDQGGEWKPLQKPENIECESTAKDQDKCVLHIHASYSTTMRLNVPMLPLSEPNAVGLILAHGSVGDSVSAMTPDVYVSDDGGYSWLRALRGPHHYAILDSGGLLVAVEHQPSLPIAQIKFSTDEGQCWHVYNFTSEPIYFTGLAMEPGARSMNVSIWGYREYLFSQYWVSVTIDFNQLLKQNCDKKDYVEWLAHSDDISDPEDGCMLGYKEKFLRMRKDSVCWNGRDYVVTKQPTPCSCTLDDFLCDFGYYREENSSVCVEQPDLRGHALEFCLYGKKEQLRTRGYRKIPGDKCEGGVSPEREEIDLSQRCVSNLLEPQLQISTGSSSSAAIVVAVVAILLLSIAGGVLFIKKYVCGGRFLVHRYSVLQQQQAEANAIESVDQLDVTAAQAPKREYHDDSDEDLLE